MPGTEYPVSSIQSQEPTTDNRQPAFYTIVWAGQTAHANGKLGYLMLNPTWNSATLHLGTGPI